MRTVKRTNDEWRTLLADQRASGQSQEEWCAAHGVNLYTLRDRASRLRKLDGHGQTAVAPAAVTKAAPKPKQQEAAAFWMEVTPETEPENTADIRIEHGGFTVTVTAGFDAELLTAVLRAVSRACC